LTPKTTIKTTLPASLLLFGLLGDGQAGLYRWADSAGNVHYTDTIPPEQVERARTEFSEGGVPVKRLPRAKTAEEVSQEKELERLRKQRQRLIEKLQAADRVLLRTFRSEDDVMMARDGKIAAIDVMIQVTRNNIRRQNERLSNLRAQAANLERSGRPVPNHLKNGISKTEGSIRDARKTITDREAQKAEIQESFARDLQRFRQLHGLGKTTERYSLDTLVPMRYQTLSCGRAAECDRLWARATRFLRSAEEMVVHSDGIENLLILAPSERSRGVALVLSRIPNTEGPRATLLLELLCQVSLRGDEACLTQEASTMIEGFSSVVAEEGGETEAN
jgi:hypothetical protein